jgi:tetratricopeptide (TPR) repeat protein
MNEHKPHSLAVALPLLLGLLLYGPAFFGETAYSFVLGIDRLAAHDLSWQQPLGGLVHLLLDTFAYLNPTGIRLVGLVCLASSAGLLAAGLGRAGVHAAGAGIAAAMIMVHPAGIAAVMKLDNTGLALALLLLVLSTTLWNGASSRLRMILLVAPSLAHPIGVCAAPLIWLNSDDEGCDALRKPLMLVLFALPLAAWIALTPSDASNVLALAGQTWINLFSGWRIGEYLPWAPEIAQARLGLEGAATLLTVLFFVFTGALALLDRFGNLLAEPARRFLPLALVAPLLAGLAPVVHPIHGDPSYALPMLLGLAILIGKGLGQLIRRATDQDNLVAAIVQTTLAVLLTSGVFYATAADQVRIFQDGQVFWKMQRGRHEAAPQSRLGYARATLFWGTDPRAMSSGKVEIQPALKAAEILDNLLTGLDEGDSLPAEQEAEARWMYSVAVTPRFANEFHSAIDELRKAVALRPDHAFYAEALERAQRDQAAYEAVIDGCRTADEEQLTARRETLMKQAESLAKAGLITATVAKYKDAVRCAPHHRDGYQYLARALASVGRQTEAIAALEALPPALQSDLSLIEQKAFIIQNLPSPAGVDTKARLAWRAKQRAKAHAIWLYVAKEAPKRPMAWLNLAESALSDGSGPAMAKAFLNKAIGDRPTMAGKGRVRQLKDRIDSALKPGTPIPEVNLGGDEAPDAGPGDAEPAP